MPEEKQPSRLEQIRAEFPFPWSEHVTPTPKFGGLVKVVDATGKEVPILTFTFVLSVLTQSIVRGEAARAATTQKEGT
jgi:hypothetical protein